MAAPDPAPSRPAAGPGALRRDGPLAAVLAVLVLAAVLATVRGPGGGDVATRAPKAVASGRRAAEIPPIFPEAQVDGTAMDHDWGPMCDRTTGRLRIPSVYAPPCVPAFRGRNGGATSTGVTADAIKVVVYVPPTGGDIAAALQGVSDDPPVQARTRAKYVEMLDELYETYGRTVELVPFTGSGPADDAAAAKADAIEVAEEIKPFASLGGPGITFAYAEELARRGVLCIGCGLAVPDATIQDSAPYIWGWSPSPEQYLVNLGAFVVRRLLGGKAEHAGPALRDRERVFGVVHFEQDPPVFSGVEEQTNRLGKEVGYEPAVSEVYTLDVPKLPERAAAIVAKLKARGVTTVIFLGDPIMPASLTQAATAQDYFPEWIVTGTVLTDTTALGRTYDQSQWAHAFGVSNLAARRPYEEQEHIRLYEWFYGEEPEAFKTAGVIYPPVFLLMLGIHMAGPDLTPQTFRDGMFHYPPSGGGPTTPRVSFGDRGLFAGDDYLAIDDTTEIWWDATATGPDEQDKDGTGMWSYANGGHRYLPGEMPSTPTSAFDPKGAVHVFTEDALPPEDRPPDYGERFEPPG